MRTEQEIRSKLNQAPFSKFLKELDVQQNGQSYKAATRVLEWVLQDQEGWEK